MNDYGNLNERIMEPDRWSGIDLQNKNQSFWKTAGKTSKESADLLKQMSNENKIDFVEQFKV